MNTAQMSSNDAANASNARKLLRRKAVEFDEADGDGDQEIDFDEFCRFILPQTNGTQHSQKDLTEWWSLMDVDGDGFIRKYSATSTIAHSTLASAVRRLERMT